MGDTKIDVQLEGLTPNERAFMAQVRAMPEGVPSTSINIGIEDPAKKEAVINSLLKKGLVEIYQMKEQLHIREVKSAEYLKLKELNNEERLLYQLIRQEGNSGIWTKDLRIKSSLQQTTITKTLKGLESRKIIKSVKSVESKNKKLYMLYELEPSKSITGGAWYSEQDFDNEFAAALTEAALTYIHSKTFVKGNKDAISLSYESLPHMADVHLHIESIGLSKVDLSEEEVTSMLTMLVYNNKIEQVPTGQYRAIRQSTEPLYLTNIPCGTCPLFDFCTEGGPVNPTNCAYLEEWKTKPEI